MPALFPRIPFIADETPISWAARQASFHTGGRLVPFLNDLHIPAADLVRGAPEAVLRLCDKAGQDPEPVLHNTITATGSRRFKLRDLEFSAEFTTGLVTRICPLCLQEDQTGQRHPNAAMRHRLVWNFAPVRTCPVHGIALRDLRTHKWDDKFHELQAMRDLIEVELTSSSGLETRTPSSLQEYVLARLEGGKGPEWLDTQNIDQVARAVEMLGGLVAYGAEQKAAAMTPEMWDQAGQAAWPLVAEGHDAVEKHLRAVLAESVRKEGHPSPKKAFGMLYSWLSASRLSKDPGPIRTILRDVIIQDVPLLPGKVIFGEPVERPRLSSVASIAKAEGINPKTLRNILRAAGVELQQIGEGSAKEIAVDYVQAKDVIDTAKHAVSWVDAANYLGASRPAVEALLELGILNRIQDHSAVQSKLGKAIDDRSVCKARTFLKETFSAVAEAPKGFELLPKSAERARVKQKVILELVFGRYLQNVFRLSGGEGLGSILVDLEEVNAILDSLPPGLSEDAYFLIR